MIIGQLTLTNGASGYLDFYVRDVPKLDILVEIVSSSTLSNIFLYDGFGGPDPSVPTPWVQPVPYTTGVGAHGTGSGVTWDLKGTSYALSSQLSNRQTVSIGILRSSGSDWLSCGIPTVGANTQINIHAKVS